MTLPAPADPSRPYVAINMVSSVNGIASVEGKASGIGGPADRKAMRQMRSKVDAVLVGAGTLRAERLNLGLDDHSVAQPLAVIVCGQEPPPISTNLLKDPSQRLLLVIPEKASKPYAEFQTKETELVPVREHPASGRLDLDTAIRELRRRFDVTRLLVEGGPGINASLVALGLVDELFVTIAPNLLATKGDSIIEVSDNARHALRLVSATTTDNEVFLRYQLQKPELPA